MRNGVNRRLILYTTRARTVTLVKNFFKQLKLGTLSLCGMSLVLFGAAGYASFAEEESQCGKAIGTGQYITGTFIPENKD